MAVTNRPLRWLLHVVVFTATLVAVVAGFSNAPLWCIGAVLVMLGTAMLLEAGRGR